MTDLISSDWKELDADNTQPSPNGVQGGYSPSQVAPIIRTIRGSLKRFYDQANPVYTSTGTGNAYVLTYEAAPAGYSKGIIYRFWAHASNTDAATLNINSLGARAIVSQTDGSPLIAGAIVSGRMVEVVYNGTAFELVSLAFMPVQQGGGANQGSAKISLGMSSGNRLLMQADSTDFGDTFPININGNATTLATYTPATLPISTPVQTALDGIQTALNGKATAAQGAKADTAAQQTELNALSTSLSSSIAGRVNKAGDTMTGNLVIGTGATPITLSADTGSAQMGNALMTNVTVKNGEMSFQRYSQASGYQWSMRGGHNTDVWMRWYYNNGNQMMALSDTGRLWTASSGYVDDAFAAKGAQCPHNSGVWEFGSIDPNYNDRLADAPFPYVLVGLRSSRGTNVIQLRAVTLRNQ